MSSELQDRNVVHVDGLSGSVKGHFSERSVLERAGLGDYSIANIQI